MKLRIIRYQIVDDKTEKEEFSDSKNRQLMIKFM